MCFDKKFKIKGCVIQDYLLEQSRITTQSTDERNYHIFYQLTAAAKVSLLQKLVLLALLMCVIFWQSILSITMQILQRDKELADRLILHGGPGEFEYLNQSGCVRLEGVDDEAKFDALRLAFEVVQIPSDHVDGIFSVLSAILWLGNLTFKVSERRRKWDVYVAARNPKSDLFFFQGGWLLSVGGGGRMRRRVSFQN